MTGSFDSSEQAMNDSSYYDISLHMYPIWTKKEGVWLYVEQAVTAMQNKPYRQRAYQLQKIGPDQYASRVYTIENEKAFIGKWSTPEYFDTYDASILTEKTGCAVFLKANPDGTYIGSTKEKDCSSSLRGAQYATSRVNIDNKSIESWDQGFDEYDKQVWGAVTGPYVFVKMKE